MLRNLLCALFLTVLIIPPSLKAETNLRIGIIPIVDVLPLFAAIDQGYIAEEGIKVELVPLWSGARIIEALAGGSIDIGYSATLSILQAAEKGLELKIIEPAAFVRADGQTVNALMVLKDSQITNIRDLKGKTVGVNTISSIAWLLATEILSREGIASGDVVWQEIDFTKMPAALEQKRIQAGWFVEPFLTVMQTSHKAHILGIGEEIIPGHSMSSYCVKGKWAKDNHPIIVAFDRACEKGIQFCLQNPDAARKILARNTKIAPEMAEKITLHAYGTTIDPERLNQFQELAKKHGLLNKGVESRDILYPTATAHQ